MPVQFKCDCSKEKFAEAIIALGAEEIQAMIDEDRGAEAVCSSVTINTSIVKKN